MNGKCLSTRYKKIIYGIWKQTMRRNGKDPDTNLLPLPSRSSATSLDSRQAERSQAPQIVSYLPPIR